MDKIGIITLNGYYNYGNRLQNYALQEVLKSYGYEVETILIENDKNTLSKNSIKNQCKKILKNSPKISIEKIINKITDKIYRNNLNIKRQEIFKEFTKKNIKEIKYKIKRNATYFEEVDNYKYFVTGSDQVWNPHFSLTGSAFFLTFAPKEKRIAYAPSFGVDKIPLEQKEEYKKWLEGMKHLSVRENEGAEIIKRLTSKSASVVVDPTLLINKKEWLSISKVPSNKPKSEYLLTYFLGDIPRSTKKYIKRIAKKNDLSVINLAQISDKTPFLSGPSEFIDYINDARLFLTNSFHGTVFSIILETPFVVYNRNDINSMNSRITTLLSKFNFNNRHINEIKNNKDLFNINFNHVENILLKEQNSAHRYLNSALKINKL